MVLSTQQLVLKPLFSTKPREWGPRGKWPLQVVSHAFPVYVDLCLCSIFVPELFTWRLLLGFCPFRDFPFSIFLLEYLPLPIFFILLILFTLILKHFYLLVSSFPVPFGFSPFLCISTSFSVFPLTLEIPKGSLLFDHCVSILLSHFCHYHYPSPTLHHPPRKNQFSPPWVQ